MIKANNNPNMDNFTPLPVYNLLPQVDAATAVAPVLDTNEIETIVRRKIVDLVSPAMVKINERVGILEITLEVSTILTIMKDVCCLICLPLALKQVPEG